MSTNLANLRSSKGVLNKNLSSLQLTGLGYQDNNINTALSRRNMLSVLYPDCQKANDKTYDQSIHVHVVIRKRDHSIHVHVVIRKRVKLSPKSSANEAPPC